MRSSTRFANSLAWSRIFTVSSGSDSCRVGLAGAALGWFIECRAKAGDFVVLQRNRPGGKVFGEVAATAGPRDQQDVIGDGQQPSKSDLRRCGVVAAGDPSDDRLGAARIAYLRGPAQRTKRSERDGTGGAFV